MHIRKQYEVNLNITAEQLYQGMVDKNFLINYVRNLYEGKCLHSSLIIKITRIIKNSGYYSSKSRNDGSSDVCLIFEADSIIYQAGDIIVGAEIKHVERTGQIICKIPHATIRLERNRSIQSLGLGKTIPVVVRGTTYSIGKPEATIDAVPFFHTMEFNLYKATDIDLMKVPTEDALVLQQMVEKIQLEQDKSKELDKTTYNYFDTLFYPFKSKYERGKHSNPHAKISMIKVSDLVKEFQSLATVDTKQDTKPESNKVDVMFLMKHPLILKSNDDIYSIEPKFFEGGAPKLKLFDQEAYTTKVVSEDYVSVLYTLLSEQLNYLVMLREHCEIYNTDAKIKDNDKVWTLYNRRKK